MSSEGKERRPTLHAMNRTPGPTDVTRCNTVAQFPTTHKCWHKWEKETDPHKVCDASRGIRVNQDFTFELFTYADCTCTADSSSFGFECQPRCNMKQLIALGGGCKGELTCQVHPNRTAYCGCPVGYEVRNNIYCDAVADACENCKYNCHAASKCQKGSISSPYQCGDCDTDLGYTGRAGMCKDINECDYHPCAPNAECINREPLLTNDFTKYQCICNKGWRGNPDGGTMCQQCMDENECLNATICGKNAKCENIPGSYQCTCLEGYEAVNNECVDIVECLTPNVCMPNSVCNNTEGSYECPCAPDFIGDGKDKAQGCKPDPRQCDKCDKASTVCELNSRGSAYVCNCNKYHHRVSDSVCAPDTYCDKDNIGCAPKPKAYCVDRPDGSGYDCHCSEGFEGNGTYCIHEDVCQRDKPCAYVGNTICVTDAKDKNKFTCECKEDYVRQLEGIGNSSAPCFEKDSYMANNCTVCDPRSEECKNVVDHKVSAGDLKTCVCKDGYKREADGRCHNKIECVTGEHDCDLYRAICTDKIPHRDEGKKYECTCKRGYVGAGTTGTCKDKDECLEDPCLGVGANCTNYPGSYECSCIAGYKLVNGVCVDIDECVDYTHKCQQFMTCKNTIGGHECLCAPGFEETGRKPDNMPICSPIDQCARGINGTGVPACDEKTEDCEAYLQTFDCICKKGLKLVNGVCVDKDECTDSLTHNCQLETTYCNNTFQSYECPCKQGYVPIPGDEHACMDEIECMTGNFECHEHSSCRNSIGSYFCVCDEGFEPVRNTNNLRPHCERKKVCKETPKICNSGACIDTNTAPYYRCECPVGTAKFNHTNCIDQKYCDIEGPGDFPCPDNSECRELGTCYCATGYEWVDIPQPLTIEKIKTRYCKEIDWCAVVGNDLCKPNAMCRLTPAVGPGTGECYCDEGFEMIDGKCEDIYECKDPKVCPIHSKCENTIGSYVCHCETGYARDSSNPASTDKTPVCLNINECVKNTHNCTSYKNTKCEDNDGGFDCPCIPGYEREQIGQEEDGEVRGCVDTDECEGKPCDPVATCHNYPGTFECVCPNGYRGAGTKEMPCDDINECDEGKDNCTSPIEKTNMHCNNTAGAWVCLCDEGFRLVNGKCVDIDECAENILTCKDLEVCVNTVPGAYCECQKGYARTGPNKSCENIIECYLPHVCPAGPGDKCVDLPGSFNCTCENGYVKPKSCASTPVKCECEDRDECKEGKPDGKPYCGKNTICTNTPASAKCECKPYYAGDPYSEEGCKITNACDSKPCAEKKNSECEADGPLNFVCTCMLGFIEGPDNSCVENPCNSKECKGGKCILVPDFKNGGRKAQCVCGPSLVYKESADTCVPSDICDCRNSTLANCVNKEKCPKDGELCKADGAEFECICGDYLIRKDGECKPTTPCEPNPCVETPEARCVAITNAEQLPTGFFCTCPKGKYYSPETKECLVDRKCQKENYCHARPHMHCDAEQGICVCDEHYVKLNPSANCTLESPCDRFRRLNHKSMCGENERETVTSDTRCVCECKENFYRHSNGTCLDINECDVPNNVAHPCATNVSHPYCVNTVGSYECTCENGPITNMEIVDGKCQRMNICILKKVECILEAVCDPPTGACLCKEGYLKKGDNPLKCVNINECVENTYRCPVHAICNDTSPGYNCVCENGYKRIDEPKDGFEFQCVDVNECEDPDACPKNSTCVNLPGTFKCDCIPPLIQDGNKNCVTNSTQNCEVCGLHAHCLQDVVSSDVYNCTCDYGYVMNSETGKCDNVDECKLEPYPCHKYANCTDLPGSYRCECIDPYHGDGKINCELINKCQPSPCPKESTCTQLKEKNNGKWTTCNCTQDGFEYNEKTNECENIDECALCPKEGCPCTKTAKCTDTQGSYFCTCPKGFKYNKAKNECENVVECDEPSLYLGTCIPKMGSCKDTIGSWECDCNMGYRNSDPQSCEIDPVCGTDRDVCDRNTTRCLNTQVPPFYVCECKEGYQTDPVLATTCEDINQCELNLHNCEDITEYCINEVPGYTCNCTTGYEKNKETGKCEPMVECLEICPEYSSCRMLRNGTAGCICDVGYDWINGRETCGIVACRNETCPRNSHCLENQNRNQTGRTGGLSDCVCNEHYQKNKETALCEPLIRCGKNGTDDINPCGDFMCVSTSEIPFFKCICPTSDCKNVTCDSENSKCDDNAICKVVGNEITCVCKEGFTGDGTKKSCKPIDICKEEAQKCSMFAACFNGECICNAGYRGNGTYCTDIDECTEKGAAGEILHTCDVPGAGICNNTQGSYICSCKPGYSGSGQKGDCIDNNECTDTKFSHDCDSVSTTCENLVPFFKCNCKEGFHNVTVDFNKCEDDDECKMNNTLCDSGRHKCVNEIPGYYCQCAKGFEYAEGTRKTCIDVDECAKKLHDCNTNADCGNYEGGYDCKCKEGYEGDGRVICDLIDICENPVKNICDNSTTKCYMFPDKPEFKCDCLDGFQPPAGQSSYHRCEDKNECENGEAVFDEATTICKNTVSDYELYCKIGYKNTHENPSVHNVRCEILNECSQDPAYQETLDKIAANNNYNFTVWKDVMVPPKDPKSGYAFCYNQAIEGKTYTSLTLPMCKDEPPNFRFMRARDENRVYYDGAIGFSCTCMVGELEKAGFKYTCASSQCNCDAIRGLRCAENESKCVCIDPKHILRTIDGIAQCVEEECNDDFPKPPGVPQSHLVVCSEDHTFVAVEGYKLVRDTITNEVIGVADIDECSETKNPCCNNEENCKGDQCVKCVNSVGGFDCMVTSSDNSTRVCLNKKIDKDTCMCAEAECPVYTSWFYECDGKCAAAFHPDLDKPEYNRKLCSRFLHGYENPKMITFNNLRELYLHLCSLRSMYDNNNYGCYFDGNADDLTTTPVFNYWGECTDDASKVKCETGKALTVQSDQVEGKMTFCPRRTVAWPMTGVFVGEPIGSTRYPSQVNCLDPKYAKGFADGTFFVVDTSYYPA